MVNKPDFFDENQTLSINSVLEITDTIKLECSTNNLVSLSKEDLKGLMQIYFDDDIVVLKSKICIENFGFKKPNFPFLPVRFFPTLNYLTELQMDWI